MITREYYTCGSFCRELRQYERECQLESVWSRGRVRTCVSACAGRRAALAGWGRKSGLWLGTWVTWVGPGTA